MGLRCAGENVEAYARCGDGREAIDFFVADGLALGDGFPGVSGSAPDFDLILLDVLAVVEPLHDEGAIKGDGLREGDF